MHGLDGDPWSTTVEKKLLDLYLNEQIKVSYESENREVGTPV